MKENFKLYFASLVLALGIASSVALKPLPDAKPERIDNIKKALPAQAVVAPKKSSPKPTASATVPSPPA